MDNKIVEMMHTSLEKIKEIAHADTVIGAPILAPSGTFILPISKLSMGFASGGVDKGTNLEHCDDNEKNNEESCSTEKAERKDKKDKKKKKDAPVFAGGEGTGVTITPIAFLIVSLDGSTKLLPMSPTPENAIIDKISSLVEHTPELIQKCKELFPKKEEKNPSHLF